MNQEGEIISISNDSEKSFSEEEKKDQTRKSLK